MDGEQQQLRNLRDFLMVYNKMTELCFSRCAKNLNYRSLTMEEEQCLDSCASKLIRSNHRLMASYVALMPGLVQRRMADYESQNKETDNTQEVVTESSTTLSDVSGTPVSTPTPGDLETPTLV
ncbi:mitochondrial import inner membrane translocase subunit Tim10 B [Anomaloglossus baeobatrachus]|uniref:mitochondrial import inner membrane translocase subunit Tim10 B n=1 Tax=Anomaloglossus baeobatrachus TaxID=238106 RepID=UPI003F506A09